MKRIRIEKDITVRWSGILTNGEPVSLEGRDLKLYIVNPLGSSKEVTDFNVTDNNIQFLFRAAEQKNMGVYRLKLYENYGKAGQTVLDQCEGFCLVATTCQEGGTATEGLDTETVELSGGNLEAGVKGLSAYEIAVNNGFVGTEAEWLASLKGETGDIGPQGPKGDKGDTGDAFTYDDFTPEQIDELQRPATEAAAVANQAASKAGSAAQMALEAASTTTQTDRLIKEAETLRVAAEQDRVKNEFARQNAETERESAETERAKAEQGRTTAEQERVSAENERVSAESSRVAAEQQRVTEFATLKQDAETATTNANQAAENANQAAQSVQGITDRLSQAYENFAAIQASGETNTDKIYIDGETNTSYRYNGSEFVSIGGSSGNGGNMILEWNTDVATTRKQVKQSDRKAGMQISYNAPDNGWVNEQYIGTTFTDTDWSADTNWKKNNEEVNELKTDLSFLFVSKDISSEFIFSSKNNGILVSNGTVSTNNSTDCNDGYVSIGEYDKLTISLLSSPINATFGLAFYNDNKVFLSGYVPPYTQTQKFDTYTVEIPKGAEYVRTTKWNNDIMAQNGFEFKCIAEGIDNVSERINEVENNISVLQDAMNVLIDASDEVTINTDKAFINKNNGASESSTSDTQISANYIDVENIKEFKVSIFHSNYANTSAGYAFYDKEKKYISGGAFVSNTGENYSAIESIITPANAKYFRYTIYNKEVYFAYEKGIKDIVADDNSTYKDLIQRVQFYNGHFVNYPDGRYVTSDLLCATIGYINISRFKRLKTYLFQSTGQNVNTGIIFYDESYNTISAVLGQKGAAEYGNIEVTVNVPDGAVYVSNTIYAPDGDTSFFKLVGYYDGESGEDNNETVDNSNYNDIRLDRIDVESANINVVGNNLGLSMDKTPVGCSILCRFKGKTVYEENGEIAYQGNSSLQMPKKGFTLTFSEKHRFKDWIEMDEYHCKGYYSDWLHCRDLMANKILEQVILTRPQNARRSYQFNNNFDTNDCEILIDSGALCHVDGFPVELYINGSYWGLYSLNIKKERDNYKIKKSNTSQIQIEAANDTSYGTSSSFNWGNVEIRNPKSDSGNEEFAEGATPNDGEVKTAWIDFLTKLNAIDQSSTTKENLQEFLNIQDWIDNILICLLLNHTDNWSKNTLYTTWDATHWSPLLYDMDNTFGIVDITGGSTKPYNYDTFSHKAYGYCPWLSKIEAILKEDIKARYTELRNKGIFSAENVDNLVTNWVRTVGADVYKDDTERWSYPGLGNGTSFIDSQYRIVQWISDRIEYLDEKYNYTK